MKKIWIDGFEANVQQRLGSSQVAYELIKNIESLDHENDYTVLLTEHPLPDLPKERAYFHYKIIRPSKFKTFLAFPFSLFTTSLKPDVFFSPTHYIPRFTNIPRVVCIFDLSFLYFPQYFKKRDLIQLTNWTKYSIQHAESIITISNSTKKDIIKNYGIDSKKITVSYPGYDEAIFKPIEDTEKINSVLKKYSVDGPYVLYIGTLQPRKNLVRLIQAFEKIDNLKLVIVGKTTGPGKQGWMFEEILNEPKRLGIEDKIIFTGFVPTAELPLLINGAACFVLASLYEGFGIPVVESMACGTPVIVSDVSSLPEVVGEAGLKVDPLSVTQIEQAIRTLTSDKKLHDKLSRQSLEQAKKFSWKEMARETIKVLESSCKSQVTRE